MCLVSQLCWSMASAAALDYAKGDNWAKADVQSPKVIDCFYIAPTVDMQVEDMNVDLSNFKIKTMFVGVTNTTNGIYNQSCRMFIPYYKQMTMGPYFLAKDKGAQALVPYENIAYEDVKAAFNYYLDNYNQAKYGRRGIVLAGYSQGAEMGMRLLADYAQDNRLKNNFVAAYLIGWPVTDAYYKKNSAVKPAKGERDLGVVISYDAEAPSVTENPLTQSAERGDGTGPCKIVAINPLNWRTDSKIASASYNKGACFVSYSGIIEKEVPHLTGAYLDPNRHTLKVTDINPADFTSRLEVFPVGVYHAYDNQFFYRNLQDNVNVRVKEYNKTHHDPNSGSWNDYKPGAMGMF